MHIPTWQPLYVHLLTNKTCCIPSQHHNCIPKHCIPPSVKRKQLSKVTCVGTSVGKMEKIQVGFFVGWKINGGVFVGVLDGFEGL